MPSLWCNSDTIDLINKNQIQISNNHNYPWFSLLSIKRALESSRFNEFGKIFSKDNERWNEELKFVKDHFNEIKPTKEDI